MTRVLSEGGLVTDVDTHGKTAGQIATEAVQVIYGAAHAGVLSLKVNGEVLPPSTVVADLEDGTFEVIEVTDHDWSTSVPLTETSGSVVEQEQTGEDDADR